MVRYVDKEAVRQDRFDNYGILSRLFRVEVDERLLDDLVAAETVEPDGGPDFNEGYRRMRAFVDSIEDVAKERSRLAVDYSLVFLGYGVNPAEKTDSARLNAAYPYESIYTTGKKTLMGKSCEGVSALYHAEAFRPNRNRILADDHMACELEFMQYLVGCEFEAARSMDSEETDNVRAKEKSFIDQHPMKWVTAFRKEIEVRSETEFYKALAQMTEGWLADEASRLGGGYE